MNSRLLLLVAAYFFTASVTSAESNTSSFLLRPAAVFDGAQLHPGWIVLVTGRSHELGGRYATEFDAIAGR